MGREARRAERKSRKRRLHWLEKKRRTSERINKVIAELEESFDEGELEDAKAFFVDYFTWSGPFSQFGESIDNESMERIRKDYGLDLFDADFIIDITEEIFSEESKDDTSEPP
ncbi:MAG: hypothetical protein COT13_05670 [Chloroflexi bacterium CG08_land_8_20_14_0_20_45_12]|nr:MAG: hypothetical protein COT13_05670 [Chloroflexi bacterium CG08_land_8_20_14_0_20_45_12]